jgi:hypothetical protein
VGYDQNIDVIDDSQGAQSSDWIATLSATLPLKDDWRRGSFSFTYSPFYVAYQDNSGRNSLNHLAQLSWNQSWSRRSTFRLNYALSNSTRQGRLTPDQAGDAAPIAVPQERIDNHALRASADLATSRRTSFVADVEGRSTGYGEEVEGRSDGREYSASVGVGFIHSRSISTQLAYAVGRVEERFEDRTGHGLTGTMTARLGGRSTLTASLGFALSQASGTETEDGTPLGSLQYDFQARGGDTLSAGISQRIGGSSGLGAAAAQRVVFLGYNRPFGPRWSGRVAANRTERRPIAEGGDRNRISTTILDSSLRYALTRKIGTAFSVQWVHQDDPEGLLPASRWVLGLSLLWRPLGWD